MMVNKAGYFEVYRSGIIRKGWRWRFVSLNGRVLYASTETYKNYQDCVDTIPTLADRAKEWRLYA